jgi:hypothetical protein
MLTLALDTSIEWPPHNKDALLTVANERSLCYVTEERFITAYEGLGMNGDPTKKPTVKYFNFEPMSRGEDGVNHLVGCVVNLLRYMPLGQLTKCYARLTMKMEQYRVTVYMW